MRTPALRSIVYYRDVTGRIKRRGVIVKLFNNPPSAACIQAIGTNKQERVSLERIDT